MATLSESTMIGRLILGAFVGALIGVGLAAALVKGLGMLAVGAVFAYLFAAVAGALTGLFAGKPVWARGGQIEAALKAVFGAVLAAGAMFALRTWVHIDVDFARFGAGAGPIGEVPAAFLPLIAGVLGALFGLDNTPEPESAAKSGPAPSRVRIEKGGAKGAAAAEEEAEDLASRRARR